MLFSLKKNVLSFSCHCQLAVSHHCWGMILTRACEKVASDLGVVVFARYSSCLHHIQLTKGQTVQYRNRPDTVKLYMVQAGIKPVPGQYHDVCWVHTLFYRFSFTLANYEDASSMIMKRGSVQKHLYGFSVFTPPPPAQKNTQFKSYIPP